VSADVEIDRPVAQVFTRLAEPDRAARWQPDVAGFEITRRTESILGSESSKSFPKVAARCSYRAASLSSNRMR
jgi:uncharacterized protein YndB with AHSA1/START domain